MELGNVRGNMPSHGLLTTSPLWHVTDVSADARSARVTSRLEFWKNPDLMAQWPFAHEYEMTYSLAEGVLEVKTTITNLSVEAMPVVIGFHPFFQIPDIPRDEWVANIPARIHVIPGEHNIPTGEMRPMDVPKALPLKGQKLDDGFTDLERDADGRAHFSIEAGGKKVETLFGPKYSVATIWLPSGPGGQPREFICFEPLATIISGVNLAHEGKWSGLQSVAPGEKWTESFWIRSSGI
jgi:aldose 1-epimerase